MKKIYLILILVLAFPSCSKDDLSAFDYKFYNSTKFDLSIIADKEVSSGNTNFNYKIKSNETISLNIPDFYGLFDFVPTVETDRVFDYKFKSNGGLEYKIIDYEYKIKYVVSGLDNQATITYNTSNGETSQVTRILPFTRGYTYFKDDWVYLSAQGNNENGSVKVDIFVEDKLKYSSQANGFGIATASGDWINIYY